MKNCSHTISGITIKYDKPDRNGRIYPKDAFDKALREYGLKMKKEIRKQKLEKIYENTRRKS